MIFTGSGKGMSLVIVSVELTLVLVKRGVTANSLNVILGFESSFKPEFFSEKLRITKNGQEPKKLILSPTDFIAMPLSPLTRLLVRSEVISECSIASGFPLWLPFGCTLAEQFDEIFREVLSESFQVNRCSSPILAHAAQYRSMLGSSYDYSNMFEIHQHGTELIVRPDNLFCVADILAVEPAIKTLLFQGSVYRTEKRGLKALIRDRHIWKTSQVVNIACDEQVQQERLELLNRALTRFHDILLLPYLSIEAPSLRDHSSKRLLSFSPWSSSEITLTSTLYGLSHAMCESLRVPGLISDLGFTAKILGLALLLGADEKGLRISSSLSPVQILVSYEGEDSQPIAVRLADEVKLRTETRVELIEGHRAALRRQWTRGIPLLLRISSSSVSHLIERFGFRSERLLPAMEAQIRNALDLHDRQLREECLRVLSAILSQNDCCTLVDGSSTHPPQGYYHLGTVRESSLASTLNYQLWARQKRYY